MTHQEPSSEPESSTNKEASGDRRLSTCSLRNLVSQAIIDLLEARSNAAGAALFEHRYTDETNRRRRAIYAGTIDMRTNILRRLFQTRHAADGTLHSPENERGLATAPQRPDLA